jgi:hypothetical protein
MHRDSKCIFEAYANAHDINAEEPSEEMKWAEEADKHDTMLFRMAGDVYEAAPEIISKVYRMGEGDFKKFAKFLGEVANFRHIKKPTP